MQLLKTNKPLDSTNGQTTKEPYFRSNRYLLSSSSFTSSSSPISAFLIIPHLPRSEGSLDNPRTVNS